VTSTRVTTGRSAVCKGRWTVAELWARLAVLEGQALENGNCQWFRVLAVTASHVYVRSGAGQAVLLNRRALAEALPHVAAGQPVPPRRRRLAARLIPVLRAAEVGPPDTP
jgi:hypothetical protein